MTEDELLRVLHFDMDHLPIERVRALHIGHDGAILAFDTVAEGSADQVDLPLRTIMIRALQLGSVALIIAHNHPSGDPRPSRSDIRLTREIADAGRALGISLYDHLIVAAHGHSSFRELGLL